MRKTALIIVAIVAIFACWSGSVQADAASMSRAQAAASPPPALLGGHCVTVRSVHQRTGTICAYVARKSGKTTGEMVFSVRSGALKLVSGQILRLYVGNKVVQTIRNLSKPVTGIHATVTPWNWWDEPVRALRIGVYKPCMTWRDGDKACVAGWLYSQTVQG